MVWNSLNGRTVVGAVIVCGWFRFAYCRVSPMSADRTPPSSVEVLPVTGAVSAIVTRRTVLSSVPVHTSTLGFLTAAAILLRVAGGSPDFRLDAPDTLTDDAFWRNVFRSVSRASTLTPAWMWVVCAPPTVSVPTTVGWVSHWSGWIPSLASEPLLAPGVEASCEKLDSSFWKVACGIW